jgi:hypothetical protein
VLAGASVTFLFVRSGRTPYDLATSTQVRTVPRWTGIVPD